MLADNQFMLEQFRKADLIGNFYQCLDITLAGEDYKISNIEYFIKDMAHPLDDYVCLKYYYDDSVYMTAQTQDRELLREGVEQLCAAQANERELRTPYAELAKDKIFTDRFVLKSPTSPSPVYLIHSKDTLPPLVLPSDVTIALATEEDRLELTDTEKYPSTVTQDLDHTGLWVFDRYMYYKDTRLYLLRENGRIVGHLRAENGFENIYEVGWIAVDAEVRNKGYGSYLALYFSYDCYAHGMIPHYGYAICPESERVAEKCGYSRDLSRDRLLCFALEPR